MPIFYGWVRNLIREESFNDFSNGIFFLKGGDVQEEMKGMKKYKKVYPISDWFEEPFFETKKIIYIK